MPREHASVQALLPLEDIAGDVLCLRSGEFRAVLEAGSVNFALKSEAEQEAILAGYRRFLNGLAYPVQVLVRIVPADVEAYLVGIRGGRGRSAEGGWRELAADHEAFVRRIARERTLLDRRCYVIVPSGARASGEAGGGGSFWRRRASAGGGGGLLAARRALTFRCAEVAQGLGAFGVSTRRLEGGELAVLWRAALHGAPLTHAAALRAASPVLSASVRSREVPRA